MPRTKLADKLELEKTSVEHLLQRIENLEKKLEPKVLAKVPGTNFFVDLNSGLVYLSESILLQLKNQNKC